MRIRAVGALVGLGMAAAACRSSSPQGTSPSYLLDPRAGLDGPFSPGEVEGWRLLRSGRPGDAYRAFQSGGRGKAAAVGRVEALVESDRIPEARAACEDAFQKGIGTVPLLTACGEAAAREGAWSEALDLFEAASLRAPDLAVLRDLKKRAAPKAAAELVRQGEAALNDSEVAEAESAADRAAAIEPANIAALRLSGAAAVARGDEAKGFGRYLAAWNLDRNDGDAGERAGDLALKIGRYDSASEIFTFLARHDGRFRPRAEESQEEFVISNWPGPDRASAHAARLTRAQAAVLLWRLLPEIRNVPVSAAAPVATDILSRADQRVLAHCLGIGLLSVDASTHRARPDVFLTRTEAVRLLVRAAALTGRSGSTACIDAKAQSEGLAAAAAACDILPSGKNASISGREFRRAIAALSSPAAKAKK